MTIDEITDWVEGLGGVLTLRPAPGDGSPEIAWGDLFFYWAPDGVLPHGQPFATVVTKSYPGEPCFDRTGAGTFRVNVHAGVAEFRARTGRDPYVGNAAGTTPEDVVLPHPVYGDLGWLCVVNPGPGSADAVRELLVAAHDLAQARRRRRGGAD